MERRPAYSRRHILRTGFAAIAVGATGKTTEGRGLEEGEFQRAVVPGGATTRPVDIHAHYYSQAYLDMVAEEGQRFGGAYRTTDQGLYVSATSAGGVGPVPINIVDLKQRIADMDRQGVAVQALSLTAPMVYWADPEFNHKLARTWNDTASAAHQAYPTRLIVLATLPMLDPDRAIDELNRASKLPGVRGLYMGTNVNNRDLDDPLFEPVWTQIERLDLPVFLHPLQTVGGQRTQKYYLTNLLGNPLEAALAACHLIFGGVLDRHPKLMFALPHAGGVLPILIGRIDHGWQVRPEVKDLPHAPSTYLHRFFYDTIAHSKRAMEFVIREVGADRVMIGSDFCFDMGYDRPLQFLEQIDLTRAQRRMILGETATRLLKL